MHSLDIVKTTNTLWCSVTRSKQTEDLYNAGKQVMNNCTEALSTSNEYKCILITTQDI